MKRIYNMSDNELLSFAFELSQNISTDLSDFENYGITSSSVSQLKELIDNFAAIYPDNSVRAEVAITAREKNKLRATVINEIGCMIMRVELKWGRDSANNKLPGVGSVRNISDGELLHLTRYVQTKMTEYLNELTGQGLTQQILDNFSNLNDNYELALNQKSDSASQRLDTTTDRIAKGNELFNLAAGYCDLGKRIYANSNRIKYNNYLIYKNAKDAFPKIPENLIFDKNKLMIQWEEMPDATSFEVVAKLNNSKSKWKSIFKGQSNFANLKSLPGEWVLKIRARNSRGYGGWSQETVVNIVL